MNSYQNIRHTLRMKNLFFYVFLIIIFTDCTSKYESATDLSNQQNNADDSVNSEIKKIIDFCFYPEFYEANKNDNNYHKLLNAYTMLFKLDSIYPRENNKEIVSYMWARSASSNASIELATSVEPFYFDNLECSKRYNLLLYIEKLALNEKIDSIKNQNWVLIDKTESAFFYYDMIADSVHHKYYYWINDKVKKIDSLYYSYYDYLVKKQGKATAISPMYNSNFKWVSYIGEMLKR